MNEREVSELLTATHKMVDRLGILCDVVTDIHESLDPGKGVAGDANECETVFERWWCRLYKLSQELQWKELECAIRTIEETVQ